MANWDGFRPYKNLSSKTVELANLVFLGLPPALRTRPEFIFTWWGSSTSPSNLNPFLDVALSELSDWLWDNMSNDEGAVANTYYLY